jgi:hypothetical protein
MTQLAENSNFAQCNSLASSNGYSLFGLGDGGTCYGSMNETEATQYGEYPASVTLPDGKVYGTENVNAIYKLKEKVNLADAGKVGYVNEDTVLFEYPDSMISNSGSNFNEIQGLVFNENNAYNTIPNSSINQCQQSCINDDQCGGYTLDNSQNCFLLNSGFMQNPLSSSSSSSYQVQDHYVRVPTVTNNESCSTTVNTIDSNKWEKYVKAPIQMSPKQECGVAAILQPQTIEINEILKELNPLANSMSDINTIFETNTDDLFQTSIKANKAIKNSYSFLEGFSNVFSPVLSENIKKIKEIDRVQKQTSFNLWKIVTSLLVFFAAGFLYYVLEKQ